jgi:TAG lipase/steryl ester hydrolase/phospholipase A2/LPA acyltransferase
MLFLVRTSLARGIGDMGNIKLYKHSHIGTKHLIERYINSTLETLRALLSLTARNPSPELDSKMVLEQVVSARQSFGRSALLLSGGATFGMSHIGVIKTLWEAHLLPRIISGASAGSIVCAVLCTQTDEQIPEILEKFAYGDLSVFELRGDEDSILRRVARFLKIGAWIDISHLMRVMRDLLGDMTFQEAYNRTRRILNICVSSASVYELPRLLNYVTAPNVLIWSAVSASCSVPLLFSAASILAKDPNTGEAVPWNPSPQRWIDGSVDNDLPMTRLAEMFNVNHFIVSQVNPHVVPFLAKDEEAMTAEANTEATWPSYLYTAMHLAKGEALHRMHVLAEMGIFPNTLTKARSVLSQKYSGDITIFPEISYADFPRMLKNPTTEFMLQATLSGERATWAKMSRIRNHCAIELALDEAVQQLRARVVFSPSQVNLRLNAFNGLSGSEPGHHTVCERGRGRGGRRTRRPISQDSGEFFDGGLHIGPAILAKVSNGSVKSQSSTASSVTRTSISDLHLKKHRQRDDAARPSQIHIPPAADFTSSGAESPHSQRDTSNASGYSSDTSTPASPSYFPGPSSTASNLLFPFASVPTTPDGGSRAWTFFNMLSPNDPHPRSPGPGLTMTSADTTLTPSDISSKRSAASATASRRGSGQAQGITGPVEDLSGTRGMVLRRLKSERSVSELCSGVQG